MAYQIQLRRMTDAARQLITPANGEPVWTTDTKEMYMGDGVTVGGNRDSDLAAASAALDATGWISQNISTVKGGPRRLPTVWKISCGDNYTAGKTNINTSRCTPSIDNANYVVAPSLKLTMLADQTSDTCGIHLQAAMDPNLDLSSATDIVFRFYLYPGIEGTNTDFRGIASIALFIVDGAEKSTSYNLYTYFTDASEMRSTPGWYEVNINKADYATLTAGFDWASIDRFEVVIYKRAVGAITLRNMTPVISYDSLRLVTADKARIMWRFDDCYAQVYSWCGYLEQLEQFATLGVITDLIGTTGYLTLDQLHRLQDAGHLIQNHNTIYHDSHGGSTSGTYFADTALMLSEYRKATQWLNENGFTAGSQHFLVPGGKWSHDWDDLIATYMDSVFLSISRWRVSAATRTIGSQANTKYIAGINADLTFTEAAMKALIDTAILTKGIVPFYLHGNASDTAKFKAVADYAATAIAAETLECVTPYDYVRL